MSVDYIMGLRNEEKNTICQTCMVACDEQSEAFSWVLIVEGVGFRWWALSHTYITEVMAIQKLSDTQLYKMHIARDL
jgi:hypothetical protein